MQHLEEGAAADEQEHCAYGVPTGGQVLPHAKVRPSLRRLRHAHGSGRQNGGQRVCTCLIYLNSPESGGCTYFDHYDLRITPEQGKAVVFFPATTDGQLVRRMLHAAGPAVDEKWVIVRG